MFCTNCESVYFGAGGRILVAFRKESFILNWQNLFKGKDFIICLLLISVAFALLRNLPMTPTPTVFLCLVGRFKRVR